MISKHALQWYFLFEYSQKKLSSFSQLADLSSYIQRTITYYVSLKSIPLILNLNENTQSCPCISSANHTFIFPLYPCALLTWSLKFKFCFIKIPSHTSQLDCYLLFTIFVSVTAFSDFQMYPRCHKQHDSDLIFQAI